MTPSNPPVTPGDELDDTNLKVAVSLNDNQAWLRVRIVGPEPKDKIGSTLRICLDMNQCNPNTHINSSGIENEECGDDIFWVSKSDVIPHSALQAHITTKCLEADILQTMRLRNLIEQEGPGSWQRIFESELAALRAQRERQ